MSRLSSSIAAAVLVLAVPPSAFAWNSTGHRVVALIAYKSLDGATKAKVCDILRDHPAAESLWVDRDVNSPQDEKASLFLNAATFPDDAKVPAHGFSQFNRRRNHYVNYKLADDGTLGDAFGDGNLLLSFEQNKKARRTPARAPWR
jgi:hypothetical protein